MTKTDKITPHFGFVALIGAPNVGKSTLLNNCVGSKVSIVSPKVQTTRSLVRGIALFDASQIVFIDTPGLFDPRSRLQKSMVRAAWRGVEEADLVVFLFDASRGKVDAASRELLAELKARGKPSLLVINKIDLVPHAALLALITELNAAFAFEETFLLSAVTGDGVRDFVARLAERLPEGPWMYPEDQLSDLPERLLAAEITREKIFLRLHQELPYAAAVSSDSWEVFDDGSVKIQQTIFIERQAQKKILIGAKGAMIKAIRLAAQEELSLLLGKPVHLFLFVKVRDRWSEDPERYREWGLDYNV